MKKYIVSGVVVALFVVYVVFQKASPSSTEPAFAVSSTAPTDVAPAAVVSYKDGTYPGSIERSYDDTLQTQVVIASGKIADVVFLKAPNHSANTVKINTRALPILRQEAIQAQSAKVSVVSGATDSSGAFTRSLTSALAQATVNI